MNFHALLVAILFSFIYNCNAQSANCSTNTTVQLPGDLQLGACNSSTICQFLTQDPCNNVSCVALPGDCNIYTCINGVCKITGTKTGCCQFNSTCDDGNPCTTDYCQNNMCFNIPGISSQCTRDFDCPPNRFCNANCTCTSPPVVGGFCNTVNQCLNGNPCLIATCDPNNRCSYQMLPSCCTTDMDCEIILSIPNANCYRISSCQLSSHTCVANVTDVDRDGIPCPQDCNDLNPAIGLPVPLHLDSDGDGFGSLATFPICLNANAGFVNNGLDCDDGNICVYPGNYELCRDGLNNDCGNSLDERSRCVDLLDTSFNYSNIAFLGSIFDIFGNYSWVDTRILSFPGITNIYIAQNIVTNVSSSQTQSILSLYVFSNFQTGTLITAAFDEIFSSSLIPLINPSRMTSNSVNLNSGNIGTIYPLFSSGITGTTGMLIKFMLYNTITNILSIQIISNDSIVGALLAGNGYVVWGAPTICINSFGNMVATYEIAKDMGGGIFIYQIVIAKATVGSFPYVWSQMVFTSAGPFTSPPNPVIRLTILGVGFAFANASNTALTYIYGQCSNTFSDCFSIVLLYPIVAARFIPPQRAYLDSIILSDGRPVFSGQVLGGDPNTQLLVITVCFPPSNAIFAGTWICQQIEPGSYPSLTLLKQRLFVGYWATEQALAEPNGPWSFETPTGTYKYATNCIPIPSGLAWNKFQLPQSQVLQNNVVDPNNSGTKLYPNAALVAPDLYTNFTTLTVLTTNYIAIEIYG